MVFALFTMAFVVGPALFLMLEWQDHRRWPLSILAIVFAGTSFVLRSRAQQTPDIDAVPTLLSLTLIWLAWILVLVLATRAIRNALHSSKARRTSRALGAMGTTLPWFGFATAQMMAD